MTDNTNPLRIMTLGPCAVPSPIRHLTFVPWEQDVLESSSSRSVAQTIREGGRPAAYQAAGPRDKIYFEPGQVTAGIVNCGGICPGLNDVIRALVLTLHHGYSVTNILGFKYGYEGLNPQLGHKPVRLTPQAVDYIHEAGGTILGTSRGAQPTESMLDYLVSQKVNVLFTIGGDGTLRGAHQLAQLALKRNIKLAVVGIPKTIDNDIGCLQRSFGFDTAAAEAARVLHCAHAEAKAARAGVGLVKLMGRESGFIAGYATLASGCVNCCLVPEVRFTLPALLGWLRARLDERGHAVIAVAEGAGQDLVPAVGSDASGNRKMGDIGLFLREAINADFAARKAHVNVKYIDPSYIIRSLPANAQDAAFCLLLGQHAVHAAMAGCTDMLVGIWRSEFTHVPLGAATAARKTIDPASPLWSSVLTSTGQPADMT